MHDVSIRFFLITEGLDLLKKEIKIFNSQLKLMKKPF